MSRVCSSKWVRVLDRACTMVWGKAFDGLSSGADHELEFGVDNGLGLVVGHDLGFEVGMDQGLGYGMG